MLLATSKAIKILNTSVTALMYTPSVMKLKTVLSLLLEKAAAGLPQLPVTYFPSGCLLSGTLEIFAGAT